MPVVQLAAYSAEAFIDWTSRIALVLSTQALRVSFCYREYRLRVTFHYASSQLVSFINCTTLSGLEHVCCVTESYLRSFRRKLFSLFIGFNALCTYSASSGHRLLISVQYLWNANITNKSLLLINANHFYSTCGRSHPEYVVEIKYGIYVHYIPIETFHNVRLGW